MTNGCQIPICASISLVVMQQSTLISLSFVSEEAFHNNHYKADQ
jgi:hypothetical protein